jgi:hypothetical protein
VTRKLEATFYKWCVINDTRASIATPGLEIIGSLSESIAKQCRRRNLVRFVALSEFDGRRGCFMDGNLRHPGRAAGVQLDLRAISRDE